MTLIKRILLVTTVCLAAAQTVPDDPNHNLFGYSPQSPTFDTNQGDVVMKEAVLYLTPSQIKAFEASQGQNANQDQSNQYTEEDIQSIEAEIKRQLEQQNIFSLKQNNNKLVLNYPPSPAPVVEESGNDDPVKYSPQYQQNWTPIPQQEEAQKYFYPLQKDPTPQVEPNYIQSLNKKLEQNYFHKPAESYSYVKFFTDHDVHETPKLQQYHPIPHEHNIDPELAKFLDSQNGPVHNKQYKLVPYEYKTPEIPRFEDLKQITQLTDELEHYNNEQRNIQEPGTHKIEPENFDYYQKDLKYAPQFDRQSSADDQKYLIKVEKENALARAEAILKAPPVVLKKEFTVRRRPVPFKHLPNYHSKDRPQRYIPQDAKKETTHRHTWKH